MIPIIIIIQDATGTCPWCLDSHFDPDFCCRCGHFHLGQSVDCDPFWPCIDYRCCQP